MLVRGAVRAKPYSSGATTFVFVYSITGVIAPNYMVDGTGGRLDPVPEVPTLLCISRRGRVTDTAIELIEYISNLLHDIRKVKMCQDGFYDSGPGIRLCACFA
jgi:hypothetical protein